MTSRLQKLFDGVSEKLHNIRHLLSYMARVERIRVNYLVIFLDTWWKQ